MDMTTDMAKIAARSLRSDLAKQNIDINHSTALELVAHQLGWRDPNTASAGLERHRADMVDGLPVDASRLGPRRAKRSDRYRDRPVGKHSAVLRSVRSSARIGLGCDAVRPNFSVES
jgi:hypothetical protein